MAANDHLNQILFHASLSATPPHKSRKKNEHGDVIHAGTVKAAIDRIHYGYLSDDDNYDFDSETPPQINAYMHVYEAQVPKNAHVYDDPSASGYTEYHDPNWESENAIDENNLKEVTPYINRHEDYGSTSYAIPKQSIRQKKTKYIGSMPFTARAEIDDDVRIKKELGFD